VARCGGCGHVDVGVACLGRRAGGGRCHGGLQRRHGRCRTRPRRGGQESWAGRVEGESAVLRWRPGIVNIGGDLNRAISRGPYILQTTKDGVASFSVGFYQTVWVRDPDDMAWRVLLDGGASTLAKLSDRVAAEAWVVAQAMSDCAAGSSP
jgi:hypothetical protein